MATDTVARADDIGEEPTLETTDLVKKFGRFAAVDGVSIEIEEGEFRSIIGPNGAGKTTLFNLITGALQPTTGEVRFQGEDITNLSAAERVRRGIGRSFQIINIFGGLTVRENIRLAAQSVHRNDYNFLESLFKPTDRYEDINALTEDVLSDIGLLEVADAEAEALPYGDKRRLEIGVVLATDPDLVMFDEPTAGMSIDETNRTIDLIDEVLEDQTLLLIEHDMELVMSLSDWITVLNEGQVIAEGAPEEISADQAVQDAYLGGMVE